MLTLNQQSFSYANIIFKRKEGKCRSFKRRNSSNSTEKHLTATRKTKIELILISFLKNNLSKHIPMTLSSRPELTCRLRKPYPNYKVESVVALQNLPNSHNLKDWLWGKKLLLTLKNISKSAKNMST